MFLLVASVAVGFGPSTESGSTGRRRRVAIRSATYDETELRHLQDRIVADDAWFKSIPAQLQGVDVDPTKNAVEIDISTTIRSVISGSA